MYTLEMKRFIKRRGVVWLTLIVFALSALLGFSVVWLSVEYNIPGREATDYTARGRDAIAYRRSQTELIEGDYTAADIAELERRCDAGLRTGSAPEDDAIVEPAIRFFNKIDFVVDRMGGERSDYFEARKELIEFLAWDGEAAMKLDAGAAEPFRYEYGIGDSDAEVYVCVCQLVIALASAGVASTVFTRDYATGAYDIMSCARHGKGRFARTKILAAMSYSALMYLICCGLFSVIVLISFGTDNSAAQFKGAFNTNYVMVPGGITSNGFYALCVLAGFLSTLALTGFALWVSSFSSNSLLSLALTVLMALLPYACIPLSGIADIDKTWPVWLENLLPAGSFSLINGMRFQLINLRFLSFCGLSLWTPFVMLAAAVIETPLFALLARRAYVRHECA